MPYINKTNHTRQTIMTAFIALLSQHHFTDITVDDLAREATISRSSFYRYFEDKYAVINQIEDDIIHHIECYSEKRRQQAKDSQRLSIHQTSSLLESLQEYKQAIHVLLGENGDPYFEIKLRRQISKRFFDHQTLTIEETPRNHLIKEYQASIMIDTFKYWSSDQCEMSVKEMVEVLRSMYHDGLFHAIATDK